jgi:Tol biopolymer transport system component
VINADGSGLTQLTDNAPVGEIMAVSPDGKQIAFLGQAASNPRVKQRVIYDLHVINADGTGLTSLSDEVTRKNVTVEGHGLPLPSPSFSPDSKQIAFLSSTEGAPLAEAPYSKPDDVDMYVVNVDGTDLTRLTNTKTQEGILTWV